MAIAQPNSNRALRTLQKRWWLFVALGATALLAAHLVLRHAWGQLPARSWLLLSAGVFLYEAGFLRRNLVLNRMTSQSGVLATFGAGNGLSLMRGLCIALLAGFLFSPRPPGVLGWAPAILYTLGDAADYFDGYLARVTNHTTLLGAALDMEWDALGMLVAVGLAIDYGALPLWFLPIGLARYGFILGIWLLERRGRVIHALPPSTSRRAVAGLTMGFMTVMLWPIVPAPIARIAGLFFLTPFAASFLRDWLVVSGIVDPQSPFYLTLRSKARTVFLSWLPLLLRPALAVAVFPLVIEIASDLTGQIARFSRYGFPLPVLFVPLFALVEGIGLTMVLFGFAGRFAAFALLFPVGFTIVGTGASANLVFALCMVLAVLILGTGAFSLWTPEAGIFSRRAGERTAGA